MSILRSAGGWGIIGVGTAVMALGYVLSISAPFALAKTNTVALGLQMKEIGFMLIVVGFIAWFIVFVLRELGAV